MLSLECVCYMSQHTVRREICFIRPRFLKGVWRYLYQDGYEHITSRFSYCCSLTFRWRVGIRPALRADGGDRKKS